MKELKAVCLKAWVTIAIMSLAACASWADPVSPTNSSDKTFGPFTFVNNTGQVAYDLETVWALTGGSLSDCVVTTNAGPGKTKCRARSNMVTIKWNDGGLMMGGDVAFEMDSAFGAEFAGGNWTNKAGKDIGPATPTSEPATLLLFGLGAGLLGLATRLKVKT